MSNHNEIASPEGLVNNLVHYKSEMVAVRHAIHAHPEVGFQETKTAALVAASLHEWGLDVRQGIGGTGIVASLRGTNPGNKAIGLRADMDALHIQEIEGRPHRSQVRGKMHACGHDGHTAMLLGAAHYLSNHRSSFAGEVVFIFQPAEEVLAGARRMIDDGLFDRFPVDAVYGMHNMPGIPAGEFRVRSGPSMAASDTWSVTFLGTGGTAAQVRISPRIRRCPPPTSCSRYRRSSAATSWRRIRLSSASVRLPAATQDRPMLSQRRSQSPAQHAAFRNPYET